MPIAVMTVALAALSLALAAIALVQAASLRTQGMMIRLCTDLDDVEDPMEYGRQVLRGMAGATHAAAGLLYCRQEGLTGLRLKTAYGMDQGKLGKAAGDPHLRSWIESLAEARRPAIGNSDAPSGAFLAGYPAAMAVPLVTGSRQIGLCVLLRSRGRFGRREVAIIEKFAPHAAALLDRAQMYLQNKGAADENARLYLNLSKLYRSATVDNLTGLHNRSYMQQRLREEIKKAWRFKNPLSVLLLDIDLFCQVNEYYGQEVGDEVLREIARYIRQAARDYDIVGRFGGEEILLILPQTELQGAMILAERLRQETGDHPFPEGVRLTCSLGVASLTPDELSPPGRRHGQEFLQQTMENLLGRAEKALALAKEAGRNRIEVAAAAADQPSAGL